jgi:rhamnosyltransferase
VAYFPDAGFEQRLAGLLPQVGALLVVDNTPAPQRARHIEMTCDAGTRCRVLQNEDNLGIATALNQGLAQARAWGCDWLLTLDQDSDCRPDMVQTLLSVAAHCTPAPQIVGGNYVDGRNGNRAKVAVGDETQFVDQKTVITSGCLVAVPFAQAIGGFRDDYFIDQVDHEFCLRARAQGARIVISRKLVMAHSVGEEGGAWLPLLGRLPNHSPLRKYYLARNSIATIATYWRAEPDWCARRGVRLLLGLVLTVLLERPRLPKLRAYMGGLADGFRGRMGRCRSL